MPAPGRCGAPDQTERRAGLIGIGEVVVAPLDRHYCRVDHSARVDDTAVDAERAPDDRSLLENGLNVLKQKLFGEIHQRRDERPERKPERVLTFVKRTLPQKLAAMLHVPIEIGEETPELAFPGIDAAAASGKTRRSRFDEVARIQLKG